LKIDIVYIACYRYDIRLTRILVASIRYWYPDLPICLVKDEFYGGYDTSEIESVWNVSTFPAETPIYGWGFGNLEPLFQSKKERCLVLDSDIVMAGKVLDLLEQFDEDFVVTYEKSDNPKFIKAGYFDPDEVKKIDPDFNFRGYTFNGGQFVASTGVLSRDDFARFVEWTHPPTMKVRGLFKYGDQGVLNYVLTKKCDLDQISLKRIRFMEVADDPFVLSVEDLRQRRGSPFVIHWCGLHNPPFEKRVRVDILKFFEDRYYERIRFGFLKRHFRIFLASLIGQARALFNKIRRKRKT
jgi:lipopolysaccharide biosynthesis glycosyltransferase